MVWLIPLGISHFFYFLATPNPKRTGLNGAEFCQGFESTIFGRGYVLTNPTWDQSLFILFLVALNPKRTGLNRAEFCQGFESTIFGWGCVVTKSARDQSLWGSKTFKYSNVACLFWRHLPWAELDTSFCPVLIFKFDGAIDLIWQVTTSDCQFRNG